jgi:hypothetical protein
MSVVWGRTELPRIAGEISANGDNTSCPGCNIFPLLSGLLWYIVWTNRGYSPSGGSVKIAALNQAPNTCNRHYFPENS